MTQKEMVYTPLGKQDVLFYGEMYGLKCAIINYGTHPCSYINIEGTFYDSFGYDSIPLNVHGGLTFEGELFGTDGWVGWDYNQMNDYNPFKQCGKKWSTEELIQELRKACKQYAQLAM